jgi:hypothetical protein
VSTAVADAILAPENTAARQIIVAADTASQVGGGWFAHDLAIQVSMRLWLEAPQAVEVPHVMGFLPGYDDNLADQLVIILAAYDGLGQEPDGTIVPAANDSLSSVGVMLEMARLWEAENLDPRRSVLFIAWGSGQLDESGDAAFLADNDHFRKLAARVNTPPLTPALVFQLGPLGDSGQTVLVDLQSDAALAALWREAAQTMDLPVGYGRSPQAGLAIQTIPALTVYGSGISTQTDTDRLDQVGQTLTLSLVEILRQVNYQ